MPRQFIKENFKVQNQKNQKNLLRNRYCILMVSDQTVPKFGGSETHIYNVSQCLIQRGHKVIGIGNKTMGTRAGLRHYACGLKYYHLNLIPTMAGVSFFALWNVYSVV